MSQEAQLESAHGHGEDAKRGMEFKDGRAERNLGSGITATVTGILKKELNAPDNDSDLWNYDLHAEVSNGVVHVTGVLTLKKKGKADSCSILKVAVDLGVAVNSQVSNRNPGESFD